MKTKSKTGRSHLPKITVRRCLLLVAVISIFFGLWNLTNRQGVEHVIAHVYGADSENCEKWEIAAWVPAPFIVRINEWFNVDPGGIVIVERYYLWFFGRVFELPWQEEPPNPVIG